MATILLIDDDEDLRGLTADLLELHGHEVRTCSNGVEGLHALDEAFPQLVITDVEMPALDGPAMVQRMFVDNIGRENIPVVIVSGAEGVSKIAAAVGTPYYLAKPFPGRQLLQLVDRALVEAVPPRPPGPSPTPSSSTT